MVRLKKAFLLQKPKAEKRNAKAQQGNHNSAFEKLPKAYFYTETLRRFYDNDVCHCSYYRGISCKGRSTCKSKPKSLVCRRIHYR